MRFDEPYRYILVFIVARRTELEIGMVYAVRRRRRLVCGAVAIEHRDAFSILRRFVPSKLIHSDKESTGLFNFHRQVEPLYGKSFVLVPPLAHDIELVSNISDPVEIERMERFGDNVVPFLPIDLVVHHVVTGQLTRRRFTY